MYVNPRHLLTDRDAIHSLMASHPLGAWVCRGHDGLIANHVPFLLDRSRGPFGTLIGHVARANTVWRELGPATPSVMMFQGPQACITPGWYPGKAQDGKVVPTWNYVVAHAHGVARAIEDRGWLLDMLKQLTCPSPQILWLQCRRSCAAIGHFTPLAASVANKPDQIGVRPTNRRTAPQPRLHSALTHTGAFPCRSALHP